MNAVYRNFEALSTMPESEQKQRRNLRRQRNLFAKNDRNRGAVHKTATTYSRRVKQIYRERINKIIPNSNE